MIILLKNQANPKQVENLQMWLKSMGFNIHMSVGESQTIMGLIGDTSRVDIDVIKSLEIVENVQRVQEPYKNANRKFHAEDTVVKVNDEVKIGSFAFFWSQECLILTVDATDAKTGDRTIKWNASEHEGARCGNHCDNVWAEVWIHRKHSRNDLDFLAITLREEWTNWAVDEAANEDCVIRRLTFAFNKFAAADFTSGVVFFFVINREWEEILDDWLGANYDRTEHDCIAIGN